MEITVKRRYGIELEFKAENVLIIEDVEKLTYPKLEDGKTDYKSRPDRDMDKQVLTQFTNLLDELIEYRKADFDSSHLINSLFEKLPQEIAKELSTALFKEYGEDEE